MPERLQSLSDTVPYLFNGNSDRALVVISETINWVSTILEPFLGWQILQHNKAMPATLARRIRSINAELDILAPEKEKLQHQLQLIQSVYETAESLPIDEQRLKEAMARVERLSVDSAKLFGKTEEHNKNAEKSVAQITDLQKEADALVQQCQEAYRTTTTQSLAAAFDQRAKSLNWSIRGWVALLLVALLGGAILGMRRVELLSTILAQKDVQWGAVWVQITLSLFSVGAPVWFAWLATKQIGQRFRLAGDYQLQGIGCQSV